MLRIPSTAYTLRNVIYFFALIAGWPCVFYLMGWLPNYQINYIILLFIAAVYAKKTSTKTLPKEISLLLVVQMTLWACYAYAYVDTAYFTRIIMLMITYCLLLIQHNDRDRMRFITVYDRWLLVQGACGTIGMFLVLAGVLEPIFRFTEMDGRSGYFFGMFTTNTYVPAHGIIRNAGFYDEPGALACWGMFALLYNKLFVKDRKTELILIIGLLSTLSLTYYIQLAVYLLYFYRQRGWKMFAMVSLLSGLIIAIASYNEGMESLITGRLQVDEKTGQISGDNRSDLLENCWQLFLEHPIFGMGASNIASPDIFHKVGFVGANFFLNFASDGIVGAIICYLPLIYLLIKFHNRNNVVITFIILFIGYFQRPYDSTQLLFPLTAYTLAYQFTMLKYLHRSD